MDVPPEAGNVRVHIGLGRASALPVMNMLWGWSAYGSVRQTLVCEETTHE